MARKRSSPRLGTRMNWRRSFKVALPSAWGRPAANRPGRSIGGVRRPLAGLFREGLLVAGDGVEKDVVEEDGGLLQELELVEQLQGGVRQHVGLDEFPDVVLDQGEGVHEVRQGDAFV